MKIKEIILQLPRHAAIMFVAFAALLLSACSSSNDEPGPPEKKTDRTVLVYMVAANDLGSHDYDLSDIMEMQEAAQQGHFGNSRLLIYHSPYSGDVQLKEVLPDGTLNVIKTYPTTTGASVTVERMREVIADAKQAAPALDYGLVLWSHANGWLVDGVAESAPKAGVHYSYGYDRGKRMNVSSLRQAIDGAGFSFIYIDCCYMGGIEVMYELRGATKTVVASAAEVALPGMPYDQSLRYLMSPTPNLVKAAQTTYNYYESQSAQFDRSCTIAVVDLTAIDALAAATRNIYQAAQKPVPDGYVKHSFSPNKKYYFDFAHYVDALAAEMPEAKAAWHAAFDKAVIYKAQTAYFQTAVDLSIHCGLSTNIFADASEAQSNNYTQTTWFKDIASALIN